MEGRERCGGSEVHGREIGEVCGGTGCWGRAQGLVVVVHHVFRLVRHRHVTRVEAAIGNEGWIGWVLWGFHLHLGLLSLALVFHTPVLEPRFHLQELQGK